MAFSGGLQYVTLICMLLVLVPVTGTCIWNNLPSHVTSSPSLLTLKHRLKCTHFSSYPGLTFQLCTDCKLFSLCGSWCVAVCCLGHVKNLIYCLILVVFFSYAVTITELFISATGHMSCLLVSMAVYMLS